MLVLASASPRRRELLARVGIEFTVDPADTDETRAPGEAAGAYVARVAADKARVVAARRPGAAVLAADTIVVVDGDVLGKAADDAEARAMLTRLSGRTHVVTTAVHLQNVAGGARHFAVHTQVEFRTLSARDLGGYLASGEWRGKAGAYAVQGIGAGLVRAVRGSYTNVVGLPLVEVLEALEAEHVALAALERGSAA
jgi:septum formation protein